MRLPQEINNPNFTEESNRSMFGGSIAVHGNKLLVGGGEDKIITEARS